MKKFHQLLAVGRWFPPGTPVSSTRKLISSSFHCLDMTLAVAEALKPNIPISRRAALPGSRVYTDIASQTLRTMSSLSECFGLFLCEEASLSPGETLSHGTINELTQFSSLLRRTPCLLFSIFHTENIKLPI